MNALVIRGGTIVTMDAGRRILGGDVLLEDGKIAAVGDVGPAEGVPVLDAGGKTIFPGFVQGHVHLGQALFRGLAEGLPLMDWLRTRIWPLEAAHTRKSAYWSATLGIADALLSGTTTIQDIGLVTEMDAIFQAIADAGVRAVAGKCLMDQGLGVPPRLLESAADALAEVEAIHTRWHATHGDRITHVLCPRFILSASEALWSGTAQLAGRLGIGIHTHLLEHPEEGREIRQVLGMGELEYFDRLGILDCDLRIAHGVQLGPAHVDILAGRPLTVCHCPSANLKLGSGIADLGFLERVPGVTLGIGCDGAPCNNDLDILEEMRLAALLQQLRQGPGAFSARRALELVTCEGARAIGLGERIGSIEIGKAADLCIWDLERPGSFGAARVSPYDRLVYGAARDALCWVFVGGRMLVDHGRLPTLDEAALRRRPAEEIEQLLLRAGI